MSVSLGSRQGEGGNCAEAGPCGVKTGFQAEAKAYANAESAKKLPTLKKGEVSELREGCWRGGQIRSEREGP